MKYSTAIHGTGLIAASLLFSGLFAAVLALVGIGCLFVAAYEVGERLAK
jgi:hypothetical protein